MPGASLRPASFEDNELAARHHPELPAMLSASGGTQGLELPDVFPSTAFVSLSSLFLLLVSEIVFCLDMKLFHHSISQFFPNPDYIFLPFFIIFLVLLDPLECQCRL